MSDAKRVIIGSETDDTKKIELVTQGTTETVPVSLINTSGTPVNPFAGLIDFEFNEIYQTFTALEDIYTYKLNGVQQAVITVTYPDNLKEDWYSVIKT